MRNSFVSSNQIAIRRKAVVHVAGLAVLTALLACNLSGAGNPTETPEPTATPEPAEEDAATPTTEAEETEEVEGAKVRTTADLNVRSGPDTNCPELGTFPNDTEVDVLAKDPSGEWWQVPYEDSVGWMSAAYTTPVTDLNDVQEIPGPACDAPTSTSEPTATATATAEPTCGDGVLNGSEACDGDAGTCGIGQFCNDSCQCEDLEIQLQVCGNDVKEGSEECDGGGCGTGEICNNSCECVELQIQPIAVCGNDVKEGNEECDGDASDCDFGQVCSNSCTCETLQIQPIAVCGNDVKEGNEQCDGSNAGCGVLQICNDSCQCENIQITGP